LQLVSREVGLQNEVVILRVLVLVLLVALAAIVADVAVFAAHPLALRESSGLEQITILFYLLAVASFLHFAPEDHGRVYWPIPTVLILFTLREMDLDKAFTTHGILSAKHYAGDASFLSKAIGAGVVAFSLITIVKLAMLGCGPWWRGLRARRGWALATLAALLLLVFTKSVDGLTRKLEPLGIEPGVPVENAALLLEELGEAMIPVAILLAILSVWLQKGRLGASDRLAVRRDRPSGP
jgi:hypothetical protein